LSVPHEPGGEASGLAARFVSWRGIVPRICAGHSMLCPYEEKAPI
jgi:hypothetical protein